MGAGKYVSSKIELARLTNAVFAWAINRLPKPCINPHIVRHCARDEIFQTLFPFYVQYATKSWGGTWEQVDITFSLLCRLLASVISVSVVPLSHIASFPGRLPLGFLSRTNFSPSIRMYRLGRISYQKLASIHEDLVAVNENSHERFADKLGQ